jgi:hypothetical protein
MSHSRSFDLRWTARMVVAFFAAVLAVGAATKAKPAAPPPLEYNPSQEEYVVERGDTLWSITERVAGNPFVWPKVWSFNPEITNPHWIYPGDVVRFHAPNVDLPSRTELIASQMAVPVEEGPPEEGKVEEIEGSEGEVVEDRGPTIEVVETARPQRGSGSDASLQRFVGLFVTPKEMQESGVLTNARPDKVMLSPGDEVYFKSSAKAAPKKGERFLVYRTVREVKHPETGSPWGFLTQITGVVVVTSTTGPDVLTGRIERAYVEIERGQLLTPLIQEPMVRSTRVPATKAIEGVILAVRDDDSGFVGNEELVFVDKGKNDGIQRGNQFVVLDRGDPIRTNAGPLPFESVGLLQVVEAKENAATCLVLRAQREIAPGARVKSLAQ